MEDAAEASLSSSGHAVQKAAASFLSNLKSNFRTSQGALDFVVKEVNSLTNMLIDYLKEKLSRNLALYDGYLTLDKVFSELDSSRGQSLFQGVQTQPLLDSYVAHKSTDDNPFGLSQIIFDTKTVFCRGVPHIVPKDYAYFVPFLPQLEQLLNCKDILHCVENPRPSEDGVFRSVTDGLFYRFHFVVQKHGNKVLSIVIHVDDVEFADPCKSKTKTHKLRMFYWSLGNIYPELRSTLKAINLLAIARYEVAKKYGNEEILKYFVKDLQALAEGVEFVINGEKRLFRGILQFVAADIPAAANLGGFKESHFALRPCRVCMCTRFELCNHFKEEEHLLRRIADHNKYVDQVESKTKIVVPILLENVNLRPMADDDVDDEEEEENDFIQDASPVTYADHHDPSVTYGINSRSVLADVPGFDLTKCLPYDPLHIFFEGTAELLCRLILRELCIPPKQPEDPSNPKKRKRTPVKKPKLPLKEVNRIIQECCDFGHLHVSKPSPIEKTHLDNKLKQSASQMIVLLHILPIIANKHVSEEKIDLLGQMIKIIAQSMKFEVTEKDVDNLESSVAKYGKDFVRIYPQYKTLKIHSLKHLKMQIILHGPLRQQGCFRFEAMHREFTRLVDIINNMKNIEFSLSCRHLSARNTDIMNGKEDGTFLYAGDTIKKGPLNKLSNLSEKDVILTTFPDYHLNDEVCIVHTYKQHGRCWSNNVILSLPTNDDPCFGIIVKIFLIKEEMVFLFNNLKVDHFPTFNAFQIKGRDHDLHCIRLSDLKMQFPIARFNVHFGTDNMKSFLVSGSSGDIVA